MADQFQAGVCGENWWSSPRSLFGSSPCSSAISFGWQTDLMEIKAGSSTDESDGSLPLQNIPRNHQPDSNSAFQMMGIGLSSSTTTDWNQSLHRGGGSSGESNYHGALQEQLNSSLNYKHATGLDCSLIQNEGTSLNLIIKPGNQDFPIDNHQQQQQPLDSITSSGGSLATCQSLSTGFPFSSSSYGYPSTLLQTLFDSDPQPHHQSLFENQSMNYSSANSSEFLPALLKSSLPKQQAMNPLQFSNNTPFLNASSLAALNDIRAGFLPSTQSNFLAPSFESKPSCPNLRAKAINEEVRDLGKKRNSSSTEPAFKRPRIETPSPLPTFKVRKEKLGDRITALQQLVSPFGKTDTASVLHEAIEYIRFLHDQVSVLSTPYMKNGGPVQRQQMSEKPKDQEGPQQDLRSRGLCLVPISSTFPVAAETTADFWTPTFGGIFR